MDNSINSYSYSPLSGGDTQTTGFACITETSGAWGVVWEVGLLALSASASALTYCVSSKQMAVVNTYKVMEQSCEEVLSKIVELIIPFKARLATEADIPLEDIESIFQKIQQLDPDLYDTVCEKYLCQPDTSLLDLFVPTLAEQIVECQNRQHYHDRVASVFKGLAIAFLFPIPASAYSVYNLKC
ncbi:MAG: hypothetical protein WCF65_01435 [Parachlamydiaceae bacterium]